MKTWLIVALVAVAVILGFKWLGDSGAAKAVADPATAMIANDLKFKAQAEATVRVSVLANSMKQQMAGGAIDPVVAKPTLDDLDRLHAEIDDAQRQLALLGDTPEQIRAWLQRLQWEEFQRIETQFRKAASTPN